MKIRNLYQLITQHLQGEDKMEYTTITDKANKINNVKSKIDKFEDTLKNSLNFINNHKQVSDEEKELLKLSFETMLSFLTHKSEEL